jgi:hypothetical protein
LIARITRRRFTRLASLVPSGLLNEAPV